MKNVKDLLAAAAKAAGYTVITLNGADGEVHIKEKQGPWNPYLDDGDSRRLEVALSMHVAIGDVQHPASATDASLPGGFHVAVPHNGNPSASTRLAVLYAAAGSSPS